MGHPAIHAQLKGPELLGEFREFRVGLGFRVSGWGLGFRV